MGSASDRGGIDVVSRAANGTQTPESSLSKPALTVRPDSLYVLVESWIGIRMWLISRAFWFGGVTGSRSRSRLARLTKEPGNRDVMPLVSARLCDSWLPRGRSGEQMGSKPERKGEQMESKTWPRAASINSDPSSTLRSALPPPACARATKLDRLRLAVGLDSA